MRIIHCISGLSTHSGGPSLCVPSLATAIVQNGVSVSLAYIASQDDVDLRTMPFQSLPVQATSFDILGKSLKLRSILMKGEKFDIYHAHGLWQLPPNYAIRVARQRQSPSVLSPHGMLMPWSLQQSRTKKWLADVLFQQKSLKTCTCFHATSVAERDVIRNLGFRAPIAIVPNGVDLPPAGTSDLPQKRRRRLLFLSRLHKKKGLDLLLHAWSVINPAEWDLYIAGSLDNQYARSMQKLAVDLKLKRVHFVGPVYGEEKSRTFRLADLYVLPTYSENFGIAVAEALSYGVPAIVTKGAPWAELEQRGCGWWIDFGLDSLIEALQTAINLNAQELAQMGRNGRSLVEEKYTWDHIGKQMIQVYRWLLNRCEKPDCVSID